LKIWKTGTDVGKFLVKKPKRFFGRGIIKFHQRWQELIEKNKYGYTRRY
jgi:hypothetical protein